MKVEYFWQTDEKEGTLPLAARAGDIVFFSGGIAAHPTKGIPDEVKPIRGFPYHGSSVQRQLHYIYRNMASVLETAGSSIKRIMKINSYHTDPYEIDAALRIRKDYFGIEAPPPSTAVSIPETAVRETSVTNDVIALALNAKLGREAFHKETQKTPLPTHDLIYGYPIYMQAVRGGGFIFTQGKGPSRKEGPLEETFEHPNFPYRINQIKFQTEYILNYFKSILEDMGSSLDHVVRAVLHMCDMKDIAGMDEVWRKYFPTNPPARTIVPSKLLTTTMIIEIELIAIDPKGPYQKEVISVADVPNPIGHEPQAIKAGPYVFLSGQMATDYKEGIAPEARVNPNFPFHSSSIKRQVNYILKNVDAICRAAGTSAENLVHRRAMHFDLRELTVAEEVWKDRLGDRVPPTTIFRTLGVLPVPSCTVQYDLIAFDPNKF